MSSDIENLAARVAALEDLARRANLEARARMAPGGIKKKPYVGGPACEVQYDAARQEAELAVSQFRAKNNAVKAAGDAATTEQKAELEALRQRTRDALLKCKGFNSVSILGE
jgi:hypothetical protein